MGEVARNVEVGALSLSGNVFGFHAVADRRLSESERIVLSADDRPFWAAVFSADYRTLARLIEADMIREDRRRSFRVIRYGPQTEQNRAERDPFGENDSTPIAVRWRDLSTEVMSATNGSLAV